MSNSSERTNSGFTLVELLVGILVGAIVLTMSIAVIVSTNSTSVQLLSRQEVSQSTRVAVTQVLKELGSAQSLLECRIWASSSDQDEYRDYKTDVATEVDAGNTIVSVSFPSSLTPSRCNEYFETGVVLSHASPNAICWNKDLTEGGGVVDITASPVLACLVRPLDLASLTNQPSCLDALPTDPDENTIYYYECETSSDFNYFVEPDHFVRSSFSARPNSLRPLIDLSVGDVSNEFIEDNLPDGLFSFEKTDGSSTDQSNFADLQRVETVYVNMDIAYRSARGSGLNGSDFNIYRYSQKILLQGARAFLEQGAYGGNYVN